MPFFSDLTDTVFKEVEKRADSEQPLGLTTGITELDEMLGGGLIRQELSYLVGDSGVGKSWFVLWILIQAAKYLGENPNNRPMTGYMLDDDVPEFDWRRRVANKEGKPPLIVFWSLEMAEFLITSRVLSLLAGTEYGKSISSRELMSGDAMRGSTPEETEQKRKMLHALRDKLVEVYGPHIYMEFDAETPDDFKEVLEELSEDYDICMVAIDYFRLIRGISKGTMSEEQSAKSGVLKSIMRGWDCHVMCVFAINREGQKSGANISHMHGGVGAQYDADLVFVLTNQTEEDFGGIRRLKLKLEKGRNVPISQIDLALDTATGKVEIWYKEEKRRVL